MNGLDPGALSAMTSQRNVSPPGMLPLSVWKNHSCLHKKIIHGQHGNKIERTLGNPATLCVCVYECDPESHVRVSGRCMSDTGAHVTLLAEPSSSVLSFFTLPVFVFTWSQQNDKGAQTGLCFFFLACSKLLHKWTIFCLKKNKKSFFWFFFF